MNRHSVQIKALLESKKLNRSRFNPESSMRRVPQSQGSIRNLKRSESSSSLRRKNSEVTEMSLIEQRYKKLQYNYRAILEQTKVKAQVFIKQKDELEKCKAQRQKDKKQIERLRSMIGFTKKQDQGVQCQPIIESRCSHQKDFSKLSTYSKAERSTDADMRETNQSWVRSKKVSRRESRNKTPYKTQNNKSQTTICFRSPMKQSKVRSPLSKYKFIPTLAFN